MSLSGQATITSLVVKPTFDSGNSGPAPSVPPMTFTFVSNPSSLASAPTALTITNSGSGSAISNKNNSSKVSTGVVVGIAVGVFAVLALALVIGMSIRHKRRMARRPKGNRKSWNKLDDTTASPGRKGAAVMIDVPMRTVVEKHSASPHASSGAGHVPFQDVKAQSGGQPTTHVIPDHPYSRNAHSVSNVSSDSMTSPSTVHPFAANPLSTTQASSQRPKQPGEEGTNNNNANNANIPNPFVSRSPSNSSAYHSMYHNTVTDHDAYASTLSAFPAVQMALRLNSVSSNDYVEDKSPSPTRSHYPDISSTYLDVEQHAPRKSYESSLYEQYTSQHGGSQPPSHVFPSSHSKPNPSIAPAPTGRNPPYKAIQDIIIALDGEKQPPTAWKDNNINRGSSRLSLGDDLVDPSLQNHASHTISQNARELDMDSFPLPPRGNSGRVTTNPFKDRI